MTSRSRLLLSLGLMSVVALTAVATTRMYTDDKVTFTPFKVSGIYAKNEPAGWNVTGTGKFKYTLKKNGLGVIKTGDLEMTDGKAKIETTLDEPAQILLEVTPEGGKPMLYGAAIEPREFKMDTERPADFDSFWAAKIKGLRAIAAKPETTLKDSGREDVELSTIKMEHVNGTHVYGQMARPKKPGKYPVILQVQWASPPYPLDKNWILWRAAQGFVVLNIEPHDVLPDAPQEYYDALPKELKNYGEIGATDRDKSYFVEMYLRGIRAVDYLKTRPDWDGKNIIVTGGSMGGQQALAIAGLHPDVTHVLAEEPAGCDQNGMAKGRYVGYPFFGNQDPKVLATARYIDCANFARNIHAKTLIGMGFVDTAVPPAGVWIAFNQIPGPKEAAPLPEAPHNNLATNEQMKRYRDRAEEWYAAILKGQDVPIDPNAGRPIKESR